MPKMLKATVTAVLVVVATAVFAEANRSSNLRSHLNECLNRMNAELRELNSLTSSLSWELSTSDYEKSDFTEKLEKLGEIQIDWREKWCWKLEKLFGILYDEYFGLYGPRRGLRYLGEEYKNESRQFYLLCRGPTINVVENRKLVDVLGRLESIYERSQVCLDDGTCFRGEPDLERIMAKSRDPDVLLWAWTEWRNKVGPPSRELYPSLVTLLNDGARRGGYNEIGECWREELEIDDLETMVDDLFKEIQPLYTALHAVVRYKLQKFYGNKLISLKEPLPAHLLGNMWAQNWGTLIDLLVPDDPGKSLTHYLREKNYTVIDLVKKAEDFYVSLGFSPMTSAFWKYSKLQNDVENGPTCHGTAANMFRPHDFRIILCAEVSEEDFSVIHHEMGHVAYYAEYENLPAIYQDGVNSAFQESIGDAVMYGVYSSAHLQRLGLLNDFDRTPETEIKLLLHQALMKIPQIPFAYVLEKWRWSVFKGEISQLDYNKAWWNLRMKYQGVKPPVKRTESHFDPAGKFHINDNKPYVRYFLSSILQMQLFEAMCKAAIFGDNYQNQSLPFPLHECDIYGSATATENLRKMMSLGSSVPWQEALKMVTGEASYSVRPLLNYYRPLFQWLLQQIQRYNIPTHWN